MRIPRTVRAIFIIFASTAGLAAIGRAQGALLLQDSDGLAELLSPVGHESIYFARICAASLTQLRRCKPGELGVVIARHRGIGGYDWLAIPVVPYFYSVDDESQVPERINRAALQELRQRYHDAHLTALGDVPEGGEIRRGWNQLVGAAYERRIYAFWFETTEAQDDAFIARMNDKPNRSHFSMLLRNCADFSSDVLNFYFPHTFRRHILPDGGMVTPRQVAYELERYAHKHPEIHLTLFEIPLVPGYHHSSRVGKSAAGAFTLTGYVIPIAFLNPYAGAAIIADSLILGRYPIELGHAQILKPEELPDLAANFLQNTHAKDASPQIAVAR